MQKVNADHLLKFETGKDYFATEGGEAQVSTEGRWEEWEKEADRP